MAFQIIEILDSQPERIVARVSHQNNQFTATLHTKNNGGIAIGKSFQAEIGYDEILDWKPISDFDDAKSNIWQAEDGIHLLGKVHSVLDFGDGKTIVDIYMQNGPEFFTVDLDGIENDVLESNDGLEVTVRNMLLYLNHQ